MANLENQYCESCVKTSVCEWSTKLYKLEGTDKKPGILDITINGCEQYLSIDNVDESEPKDE